MNRSKIFTVIIAVLALLFGGIVFAGSASAEGGCVTKREYRKIHTADTMAVVKKKFGTKGKTFTKYTTMETLYQTDADGYPLTDENGNLVVDGVYPFTDIVQVYKKCHSFDGGSGKVAINFDDYDFNYDNDDYTQRAYQRVRSDKYDLDIYDGTHEFRKAGRVSK